MATAVITRRPGQFRCSGVGQTVHAKVGEELPAHMSCQGGCEWEFRKEDNPRPEKVTVIIGDEPFFALIIDEVPQAGDLLNLRNRMVGSFRVTNVDIITQGTGVAPLTWPRLMVEREGDHEEGHPIYAAGEVFL